MAGGVSQFREELAPRLLETVDAVRAIVAESHAGLAEAMKWNAPSFSIDGDDRITLGLERRGGVRVVLHRGVRPQAIDGFRFDDPQGLARWPAPDRGVVILNDKPDVEQRADALRDLCSRWIAATR